MNQLGDLKVTEIVDRLKQGNPPPGGAAVAALSAAMACGLVAMVCSIAARRRSLAEVAANNQRLAKEAGDLADELLTLADRDDEALWALMQAWKMPRHTDVEHERRRVAIRQASKAAIAPPLQIAEAALRALALVTEAQETTGDVAPSDLATAGAMLSAAGMSGLCNAAVNLTALSAEESASFEARLAILRQSLDEAYSAVGSLRDRILRQRGAAS